MFKDPFWFGKPHPGVYAEYEHGEPRQLPRAGNDNLKHDLHPAYWMGVEVTPTERVRSRAILASTGGAE